jgi:hypothetical protein
MVFDTNGGVILSKNDATEEKMYLKIENNAGEFGLRTGALTTSSFSISKTKNAWHFHSLNVSLTGSVQKYYLDNTL